MGVRRQAAFVIQRCWRASRGARTAAAAAAAAARTLVPTRSRSKRRNSLLERFSQLDSLATREAPAQAEPQKREEAPICATWAASGECERNPQYMQDKCRETCARAKS